MDHKTISSCIQLFCYTLVIIMQIQMHIKLNRKIKANSAKWWEV